MHVASVYICYRSFRQRGTLKISAKSVQIQTLQHFTSMDLAIPVERDGSTMIKTAKVLSTVCSYRSCLAGHPRYCPVLQSTAPVYQQAVMCFLAKLSAHSTIQALGQRPACLAIVHAASSMCWSPA